MALTAGYWQCVTRVLRLTVSGIRTVARHSTIVLWLHCGTVHSIRNRVGTIVTAIHDGRSRMKGLDRTPRGTKLPATNSHAGSSSVIRMRLLDICSTNVTSLAVSGRFPSRKSAGQARTFFREMF